MFSRFYRSFCKPSDAIIRFTGHYAHQTPCLSRNLHTSAHNFRRQSNYGQTIRNAQIKRIRKSESDLEQEIILRKKLLAILKLEPKQSFFSKLFPVQSSVYPKPEDIQKAIELFSILYTKT
ncbi:hypothetical protein HYE68_010741 [Fusarium pseudograminearum]|nr:hypothetical protein HYE68_010741 [Fusarium pseudograminearum]